MTKPCSVEDCTRVTGIRGSGRGLCKLHYLRWYRSVGGIAPRTPPEERFWPKVEKTEGCWLWTAALIPDGYGHFGLNGGLILAHRFSYEAIVGPIPEGLTLDHLCRVRKCVRPDHLEPVTNAENTRRGFAARTHCPNGHQYTADNTLVLPGGGRRCVSCRSAARARKAQPRKAS